MKACRPGRVGQRRRSAGAPGSGYGCTESELTGRADGVDGRDGDHEAERAVAEIGKRVAGVDGQRRQHGQQRAAGSIPRGSAAARRRPPSGGAGRSLRWRGAAGSRSRKQRCCSSTSSWTRAATAAMVSAGVRPSGPAWRRPARMRRFSHATRTMKNSSRFELKMARNFTRSSRGTLGSWASSSTRRLNSSQDSSRLTKASAFTSSPPVERLAQQDAVAERRACRPRASGSRRRAWPPR